MACATDSRRERGEEPGFQLAADLLGLTAAVAGHGRVGDEHPQDPVDEVGHVLVRYRAVGQGGGEQWSDAGLTDVTEGLDVDGLSRRPCRRVAGAHGGMSGAWR